MTSNCASSGGLKNCNGGQTQGVSQTTVTNSCASARELEIRNDLLKGVTVSRSVKCGYFVGGGFVIPHLIVMLLKCSCFCCLHVTFRYVYLKNHYGAL